MLQYYRYSKLKDMVKDGCMSVVHSSLKNGKYNVNWEYNDGVTLLHIATYLKNTNMMSVLLSNGANVDAIDSLGNTCLHISAKQQFFRGYELLKNHQANETILNMNNRLAKEYFKWRPKRITRLEIIV